MFPNMNYHLLLVESEVDQDKKEKKDQNDKKDAKDKKDKPEGLSAPDICIAFSVSDDVDSTTQFL